MHHREAFWLPYFLLLFALSPQPVHSQELPLWEFGLGVGTLYLSDYRGSDELSAYVLPVPYINYNGDVFKIDESGIHSRIFGTDRILLDLSLAGGVPVGGDNNARDGMPNLDPTVELGPSIDFKIWPGHRNNHSVWLRVPVRAVFSVSLTETAQQGWTLSPFLEYRVRHVNFLDRWELSLAAGPLFGDEAYHNYFYEVEPAHATASRQAYEPGGGYAGSRFTLTLQRRYDHFWIGVFARYDTLSGAAFTGSPLVKETNYFAMGIAFAWVLAQSETRVQVSKTDVR